MKIRIRRTAWWGSLLVVSVALCAGPTWAQTRSHNPWTDPKKNPPPKTPAKPTPPANPAPAAPKPTPAPTAPTPAPKPPATQPTPAPTNPAPKPPPAPTQPTQQAPATQQTPAPSGAAAGASGTLRGLLMKVDKAAGTITVGRNGYPPLTVQVGSGADVSRDGDPAALGVLGTGSSTSVPDAVLVSAAAAANGKLVASRVKATSRDHFWYGRITGMNPSAATISVTRADGQRRTFLLHERSNLIQYGAGNVEWKAIRMGGMVEVIWIPGDSDLNAPVLAAHMVVLNKPYAGIKPLPPVAR